MRKTARSRTTNCYLSSPNCFKSSLMRLMMIRIIVMLMMIIDCDNFDDDCLLHGSCGQREDRLGGVGNLYKIIIITVIILIMIIMK